MLQIAVISTDLKLDIIIVIQSHLDTQQTLVRVAFPASPPT